MQTLYRLFEVSQITTTESELLELVNGEASGCIERGDILGAGEWLVSRLDCAGSEGIDAVMAKNLALWASPSELGFSPGSMDELLANISAFDSELLSTALVSVIARNPKHVTGTPGLYRDLAFKLASQIERAYGVNASNPIELCQRAAKKLQEMVSKAVNAIKVFNAAQCIAARNSSIELLKSLRQLKILVLPHERPILSSIEMLLGSGFREFCQSYERSETQKVVLRISDLRGQAQAALNATAALPNSLLWNLFVKPTAEHLTALADEAAKSCKVALTPSIRLAVNEIRIDATLNQTDSPIPLKLTNDGVGTATKVKLRCKDNICRIVSPHEPFAVPAGSDRIVHIIFPGKVPPPNSTLSIIWTCEDLSGQTHSFSDNLQVLSQRAQPDWKLLLSNPPYSVNPIRVREKLFGREAQLDALLLRSAAGASTFVWGQKRVGKTSLLQVVKNELDRREKCVCVFLRMGHLAEMHEGQIAGTIATRLISAVPDSGIKVPEESGFGAGLGGLIPVVENLTAHLPGWKFIVIIDEFDDLDPAFYTGERGRLFIKALRSLSEIGLTFLFAGSERMNVIYEKHSMELNKWGSLFVDTIDSAHDGRELITRPVEGAIEYEDAAVDGIFTLCSGNPFFMHLICYSLFERCVGERRTYIGAASVESHLDTLMKSLAQTNFAHYWEDNPILERQDNRQLTAENCIVLTCIATLSGSFVAEDVWQCQDGLNLTSRERISVREIGNVVQRLRARKVLSTDEGGRFKVTAPVFSRWLKLHAELVLLAIWKRFVHEKETRQKEAGVLPHIIAIAEPQFPISEDDLLSVTQNLVFCGKQKDVAEVRLWLRQFDDDSRIEIAFSLLRRLTEKGYVSDGARELAISKVIEGVAAKRLTLGAKTWKVIKGRKDNLCLSYVDSELKSGASLTREVVKRLNPGKAGSGTEISGWIKTHAQSDAIIVVLDDLSSTGGTMRTGLRKWIHENQEALTPYLKERRIMVGLLYATGRALDAIAEVDQRISVLPANTLGAEVVAFDPEAGIFEDAAELDFAHDVMLQIGRELTPQNPLGFGDQGLLFTFHNTVPNNTLPVFWSNGRVNERPWKPLFSRESLHKSATRVLFE
jgi:hypothetical protein